MVVNKRRPWLSADEKAVLWAQWEAGATPRVIGQLLGRRATSITYHITSHDGVAPHQRVRAGAALTLVEREALSRACVAGVSMRTMAAELGRAASTITREVGRNGGRTRYRAVAAEARAAAQAVRPKPCRLATQDALHAVVARQLEAQWSPAQIAGWLAMTYPDDPTMHISHETIYQSLYMQSRGLLKRELLAHLRTTRVMRRHRSASKTGVGRGQIVDAVSIALRPAAVEDRAIPGHWEGDLLSGADNTHIATLVERQSRYVHLVQVAGKDSTSVLAALTREVQCLPIGLMRSLTWDRGHEMAQHKLFTVATDVAVYFCNPHSPWQRGSNENTNGLLRQYFPKGMNLGAFTQADLDGIAANLNTRPRKTLGFQTPATMFVRNVAATG